MGPLSRRMMLLEGVAVSAATWLLMAAMMLWFSPQRPARDQWLDLALLAWIAQFLYVKSWLMFKRTRVFTRLGVSLIVANLAFGVAYQLSLAFTLWPELRMTSWLRDGIRVAVALAVTWGTVELTLTKDPPPAGNGGEGSDEVVYHGPERRAGPPTRRTGDPDRRQV